MLIYRKKNSEEKEVNYKTKCFEIAFGKLGWSPCDYYKSSPQEFYYACLGYFDKEEVSVMALRKVAQVIYGSNGGKTNDFNSFWPLSKQVEVNKVTWGSKEEADEFRRKIEEKHNIKLG